MNDKRIKKLRVAFIGFGKRSFRKSYRIFNFRFILPKKIKAESLQPYEIAGLSQSILNLSNAIGAINSRLCPFGIDLEQSTEESE